MSAVSSNLTPLVSPSIARRNYYEDEDLLIVSAWLNTSFDEIRGTGQKATSFWDRVHNYFVQHGELESRRTADSIQNRWGKIQKYVNKLCGYYANISASRKSDENLNEDDKIEKAKIMYKKIEKKEFKLVRCWKKLRLYKKWQDYVEKANDQLRPQSSTSSRRRNSSNNSSPVTDLNEDDDKVVSPNKNLCPKGRKIGKELRRRKGTNYEIPRISQLMGSYIEDRKNVHERKLKLQEFERDERIMRMNITNDMDEMTKQFYEQEKKNIMARRSMLL